MIKLNAVIHEVAIPIRYEVARIERGERIMVDRMRQPDGSVLWAITDGAEVFNKNGEWEHLSLPSSRDDAFYARCRWDNFRDAVAIAQIAATLRVKEAQARVDVANARYAKEDSDASSTDS